MSLAEPQRTRRPGADHRWTPGTFAGDELLEGLLEGRVAGHVSHPLDNVLMKIDRLCHGDPDLQFGMGGLQTHSPWEVLGLVGEACGFRPNPEASSGPVVVDPALVLESCEAVGERLALACLREETVILATGHPSGLALLYLELGRLLVERGVTLLRPMAGKTWHEEHLHHRRFQIRYLHGVGMLTDRASALHTHSGGPMFRMLQEERPDLVFADHGFAGAAIEDGVDTVSIADVNDPALLVARAQGRTETVIVMDDNVQPEAYWPCFQAIASRLP